MIKSLHRFAPNLSSSLPNLSNLRLFLLLHRKTTVPSPSLFQLTPMIIVNLPSMPTRTLLRFLRDSARVNMDSPRRQVPLILQFMTRITVTDRSFVTSPALDFRMYTTKKRTATRSGHPTNIPSTMFSSPTHPTVPIILSV